MHADFHTEAPGPVSNPLAILACHGLAWLRGHWTPGLRSLRLRHSKIQSVACIWKQPPQPAALPAPMRRARLFACSPLCASLRPAFKLTAPDNQHTRLVPPSAGMPYMYALHVVPSGRWQGKAAFSGRAFHCRLWPLKHCQRAPQSLHSVTQF